jgi:hypothetical protein
LVLPSSSQSSSRNVDVGVGGGTNSGTGDGDGIRDDRNLHRFLNRPQHRDFILKVPQRF